MNILDFTAFGIIEEKGTVPHRQKKKINEKYNKVIFF